MSTIELFERLGLALAIGLLIGLERGWREREGSEGSRTAGIRTYALISLLGGVWAALTPVLGPVPLAAAGIAFAAAFTLFQWREVVARNEYSVTSTVAGLLGFALGAFAVLGDRAAAVGAGVTTMALLAARSNLHDFVKRLTWPELRSAVLLLAMTFLLLPVLPDRTIDPFGAFNPHELWLMTVLIAAVSFAGYVSVRWMGEERGVLVSAAAGAFVSSTTVTLDNARLARKKPSENSLYACAICVGWTVGVARMGAVAVVTNGALLQPLALPIGAALFVLGVASFLFSRASLKMNTLSDSDFSNPLDLRFVLSFGAILSVVIVAARLLSRSFGEAGLLGLAGISGLVDVDPITLSAARLAGQSVGVPQAADAILLAGAANMVTKMTLAFTIGGARFGWKLAAVGIAAIAAGGLALIFAAG
jgi:uncharacterized membrane protein (DUF4010 family)